MARPKVYRRAIGRSALLDTPIESARFTFKLEERWYDSFFERYPSAKDAVSLHADLLPALADAGVTAPPDLLERLCAVHPRSGIFDGIAHWARVERAHRESSHAARCGEIYFGEGITYPARQPMPLKLAEMVGAGIVLEKRKRRRIVHPRT